MRFFLELYQCGKASHRLVSEWRAGAGNELVDCLLAKGILKRNPVGRLFPCGRKRPGCFREILDDPEHPGAYLAICPKEECLEITLMPAQVEEYWVSHADFAQWLRGALGLGGEIAFLEATYPDTVQLGQLEGPEPWDVFLSLGRDGATLDLLLAKRRSAALPSIVLAPATFTLPVGLRDEYPPGGHAVLGVLTELLRFEHSELHVHHSFYDLTRRVGHAHRVVGELHGPGIVRPLSVYEYPTWPPRAGEFDLFIDAIGLAEGLMVSRRTPDGELHSEPLSPREARILVELVQHPGPIDARELVALRDAGTDDWKSLERIINRARAKAEPKTGRSGWQLFRNVPSRADGPHLFAFAPVDPYFRWLVLAPGLPT